MKRTIPTHNAGSPDRSKQRTNVKYSKRRSWRSIAEMTNRLVVGLRLEIHPAEPNDITSHVAPD